jgi:2-polyprenyl-3-methyl-5-hydroxy-6-metoxy-1,4-benzoquinol methylase
VTARSADGGFRRRYDSYGVEGFYQEFGDEYCNPDEATIRSALRRAHSRWQVDTTHVLDLACGSGEVTLALRQLGYPRIEGIDPHTGAAYQDRTGQPARALSFEQIAAGALTGETFSLIVCSYALHLPEKSLLPGILVQLALLSPSMVVLSPHKRPVIAAEWGWSLEDEFMEERTRIRLYRSSLDQ